jgi:hypothetical protein
MKTFRNLSSGAVATLALLAGSAQAADACSTYKWDVTREVQLYHTSPTAVAAGTELTAAPSISAGKLYALTLQPQEKVRYPTSPSKKMLADGAFGGMLALKVDRAGQYRVAIDSGYWLDIVHEGKQLATVDFNGSAGCDGPRKIVVYELPADAQLTVQIAAAATSQARLTVTPVAVPAP